MSDHPLNDFFNLPSRNEGDSESEHVQKIYEVIISENPDLSEVTKLALNAYKEQMENVQHIEPKYRQRYLEVAQQYLKLAMDSISKNEELSQKREKLDKDLGKKGEGEGEEEKTTGMSRRALLEVVKNEKKVS